MLNDKIREIIAKKLGRVYRIPAQSLSFVFSGLDDDIARAESIDLKNIESIKRELSAART